MTSSTIYNDISPIFTYYNRNNSWKPYAYIVFTTGRPLCHKGLPKVKTIYTYVYMASMNYFLNK